MRRGAVAVRPRARGERAERHARGAAARSRGHERRRERERDERERDDDDEEARLGETRRLRVVVERGGVRVGGVRAVRACCGALPRPVAVVHARYRVRQEHDVRDGDV